jgi:iduronate 2-sulfatase
MSVRTRWRRNVRLWLSGVAALCGIAELTALPAKPNVLLVMADDLRPDLGCYGDAEARTPNIDRFARDSVVFERAFCPQALCAPSRSALMTGARPDTMRVWDVWTHFRVALPDAVTLPQLLKQDGWFTQALGKVYHSNLDDPASWSVPHVMPADPIYGGAETLALLAAKRRQAEAAGLTGVALARAIRSGPPAEAPDVPDSALVDGRIAALAQKALREAKARARPFFIAVGFTKPHLPFVAPKRYWDLYDRAKISSVPHPAPPTGAPPFALGDSGELLGYDAVPARTAMDDNYRRWLRHGYLAATSFMDAQAGLVLDELDRLGLRDDTIVIFWGDNGYKLGDYGAWTKTTNVELDTRIPLIVRAPGLAPGGTRAGGMVEVVDLYPTLAELLGLQAPAQVEGSSFLPLLRAPRPTWKSAVFTQSPQQADGRALMGYNIVTATHRLTRWVEREDPTREVAVELYDLRRDPTETENVATDPSYADVKRQLLARLAAGWRAEKPPR